jgi:Protein of unknown function (DUF3606).
MPYLTTDFPPAMGNDKKPDPIDNSFRGNDPRTIEIDSPSERAFWCKVLNVSEAELIEAVGAAGPAAQKVKDWLFARRG